LQDKKYKRIIKNSNHGSIDFCDFGYAITVHKFQGSEAKKVVIFQEKNYYWDEEYMKRWLYTGITRAKEKIFLITK
jgi:exodeoxyribonuclease-5